MILERTNLDNNTRAALEKHLLKISEAEAGKWHLFRTIFSSTNSSSASYMCLMTYKDGNKFKIYTVQLSRSFKLAQNVLIIRTSQSQEKGFYEQKERIETVPTEVTEEDLKQVIDFFDLIAMEKFLKQYGTSPSFLSLA